MLVKPNCVWEEYVDFSIFENLFTTFRCLFTIFQKIYHLSNTFCFTNMHRFSSKAIYFWQFSIRTPCYENQSRVEHFPEIQFPVGKREIWPISRSGKTYKSGRIGLPKMSKISKKKMFFHFSFVVARKVLSNDWLSNEIFGKISVPNCGHIWQMWPYLIWSGHEIFGNMASHKWPWFT